MKPEIVLNQFQDLSLVMVAYSRDAQIIFTTLTSLWCCVAYMSCVARVCFAVLWEQQKQTLLCLTRNDVFFVSLSIVLSGRIQGKSLDLHNAKQQTAISVSFRPGPVLLRRWYRPECGLNALHCAAPRLPWYKHRVLWEAKTTSNGHQCAIQLSLSLSLSFSRS